MNGIRQVFLVSVAALSLAAGCRNALPLDDPGPADTDDTSTETSGDSDGDSDGDGDTATDTGIDPGTDSDTPWDTDTETSVDTGTDGDTDSVWDTDSDGDTESDTNPIPCIYECVGPLWSCGERGSTLHPEMTCPEEGEVCCQGWKFQDEWPCLICSEPFPSHSTAPTNLARI